MPDITPTDVRLQLLALGYQPIPNKFKAPAMSGWNQPDYISRDLKKYGTPEDVVRSWERRFPDALTTGVRLTDGLGMADADLDDAKAAAIFWQVAAQVVPELAARSPARFGKSEHKVALAFRVEGEPFGRVPSRRYNGMLLEIFGGETRAGKVVRQFGMYGPHSEGANYVFAEGAPALHDGVTATLPGLSRPTASAFVDAFDAAMQAAGFEPEKHFEEGESSTEAFDITAETRFEVNDGGLATYDDLDGLVGRRCAASFIPGEDGRNRSRCWIFWSGKHDCVGVYDHATAVSHYPAGKAPLDDETVREMLKAVGPAVRTQGACAPERPGEKATLAEQAAWLLATHAYCAANDTVVELDEPSDGCQMRVIAFQRLFRSWYEETKGPRDGKGRAYATGLWELAETRINVRGVRMRPDMPYPVYAEAGAIYKNTYLRPRHEGSGDIAPWLAFMEHLLPARDEREWFCNWLAHKHLHPGVPGVAVVMVAVDERGPVYGAGRGILRDVIARLLGPKYVKPIDFDVFTGSSPQGIYTDWGAYATVVTVNEAKDTADSGHWANRRAVYERLKELVDPRAIERTFLPKGKQAFTAHAFASYLVFSNNRDALQIPVDDRRVTALANGGRMTGEMAAGLQAWMADAGNIAELARWLEARDLSGFDVYAPPHTDTKATMQELARSELDEAFEAVRATIGPRGLFTGEMLLNAVVHELNDASEPMQRGIKRVIRAAARKIAIAARMPPASGRGWILAWRGHDTAYVTDTTGAQQAVEHTGRRLAEQHGSRFGLPSRTG